MSPDGILTRQFYRVKDRYETGGSWPLKELSRQKPAQPHELFTEMNRAISSRYSIFAISWLILSCGPPITPLMLTLKRITHAFCSSAWQFRKKEASLRISDCEVIFSFCACGLIESIKRARLPDGDALHSLSFFSLWASRTVEN